MTNLMEYVYIFKDTGYIADTFEEAILHKALTGHDFDKYIRITRQDGTHVYGRCCGQ